MLTAVLCACATKQEAAHVQPNFVSIDLSRSDGWYDYYCIHVDSSGRAIAKRTFEAKDYEIFYTARLSDSVMKQLCAHVDRVEEKLPEAKPHMGCIDCPYYQLELFTPKNRLNFPHETHTPTPAMDSLVNYFTTLITSGIFKETDTTFAFTSFDGLIPPPPDTVLIFEPPSIN